jgi:hypothetical protein
MSVSESERSESGCCCCYCHYDCHCCYGGGCACCDDDGASSESGVVASCHDGCLNYHCHSDMDWYWQRQHWPLLPLSRVRAIVRRGVAMSGDDSLSEMKSY